MSEIDILNDIMPEINNEQENLNPDNSILWEYKNPNGKQIIRIYKLKEDIYLVKSKGIAYREGCSLAFDFLIDSFEYSGKKIKCLLDNSELYTIDWSFKLLFLKFPLANECLAKVATFGDNLYVQSFGRIYQYTFGRKFKIRSFRNKAVAMGWLMRRE
jgi:hypothetical protein